MTKSSSAELYQDRCSIGFVSLTQFLFWSDILPTASLRQRSRLVASSLSQKRRVLFIIFSCFNKAPSEDSKFLLQKGSVQKGFSCLHNARLRFKFTSASGVANKLRHKFITATESSKVETFELWRKVSWNHCAQKNRRVVIKTSSKDVISIENCQIKWKISTVHWKSTVLTGNSSKKVCEFVEIISFIIIVEVKVSKTRWKLQKQQQLMSNVVTPLCVWVAKLAVFSCELLFFHFSLSQAESSFNPFFRFWAHLLQLGLGSFNNYVDIILPFFTTYPKFPIL